MPKKKPELNRADELLDELLSDCQSPEEILGESGITETAHQTPGRACF
jgi:putative transposase